MPQMEQVAVFTATPTLTSRRIPASIASLDTSGGEDRKKRLSAQIELEKIKFVEEVPSNESEAETV